MKRHIVTHNLPSIAGAITVSLVCAQVALSQPAAPNVSAVFLDATATHVPKAAMLHALDAAFVDVDGDGDLDVILAVEGDVNRLYLNDGQARLSWRQGAFDTIPHDTEHVLSADFNRDGYADVMFIAEDDQVHQLFYGDGKGAFTDVSDRLPARSEGNGFAVGDVNLDGLPDIVLGNSGERGQNFLWLNERGRPGFDLLPDFSRSSKLVKSASPRGSGNEKAF